MNAKYNWRVIATGISVALLFLAMFLLMQVTPTSGAATPSGCNVRMHFTGQLSHARIRIFGECDGHAPTADQVARLAAPLVTHHASPGSSPARIQAQER